MQLRWVHISRRRAKYLRQQYSTPVNSGHKANLLDRYSVFTSVSASTEWTTWWQSYLKFLARDHWRQELTHPWTFEESGEGSYHVQIQTEILALGRSQLKGPDGPDFRGW